MRIVQLVPGAGGDFYCENCLREGGLVRAVRAAGHEMQVVPLYLPLRTEMDVAGADSPIFFGGVNVYLQQRWRLFRRTPRWLDRLFDSRFLLGCIARRAGMTDEALLGETTLSMLAGADGRQEKELRRLVDWLGQGPRPDVIGLSNILLAGMARRIRDELNVPVVSILQDEEGFLDSLPDNCRERAWDLLRDRARDIDAFVPVSRFYGQQMGKRLGLDDGKIHVVHTGIEPDRYPARGASPETPAIGFLSQMARSKGLHTLAAAFELLKPKPAHARLKLRVAGGKTDADEPYLQEVRSRLTSAGMAGDVEFIDRFEWEDKLRFLASLSVLSVPTVRGEAFGLYAVEAMACGVPVVMPRHGGAVEIVEAGGGGLLCDPNDPAALARTIDRVLLDRRLARTLSEAGRKGVSEHFGVARMAAQMIDVWRKVAAGE